MPATPQHCQALMALATDYLTQRAIPEARTLVELLFASVLGCKRLDLFFCKDRVPSADQLTTLRQSLCRLGNHTPIQYVIGEWDFHDIHLKTDPRALIPRPETEELVDRIIDHVQQLLAAHDQPIDLVDIGTGTGAITLALAHALPNPRVRFTAIDISPDALALAQENAQALGLQDRVTFILGDTCHPLSDASIDILISNPPYISTHDVDQLDPHILRYEPRLALDGGPDGLDILRAITHQATQILKPHGHLYFEMGDDQGPAMHHILEQAGYSHIQIIQDVYGKDRFATAQII